jgi:hypothetical protein
MPSRPRSEGRFAIVTNVGNGMRWTQAARLTSALPCGRRSRVVLTPRRWCQVGGGNSAGDGGKQARSPGRARRKPLKPLRRGCRVNPAVTVVTMLVWFLFFPREAAGAAGTRHSLRPRSGKGFVHDSDAMRAAGIRNCALDVIARSESDEAIQLSFLAWPWIASLALAMTNTIVNWLFKVGGQRTRDDRE